jgi:hypothetical protein
MEHRTHAEHLGGLLGNLQTLEFSIRLCLSQQPGSPARNLYADDFRNAPVGTLISESGMSSYASLGQLIKEFNENFGQTGATVDPALVNLRDVLAHGRVFAGPDETHYRIVKFDRPVNGSARLAYNQVMTEAWFIEGKRRVREAILTVMGRVEP